MHLQRGWVTFVEQKRQEMKRSAQKPRLVVSYQQEVHVALSHSARRI